MRPEIERLRPYLERSRSFSGWVFDIDVRHLGPPLPWDYPTIVREHAAGARSALDLGTGGGERLSALRDALPSFTVATEEWHVNAPVAYRRLRPLDVRLVRAQSRRLPFRDRAFDLVLDRHEELDPAEVARVLQPGGRVVTQQVGPDDWPELRKHVPRMTDFGDIYAEYTQGFVAAGLELLQTGYHHERVAFPSLGDFVYLLGVAPWIPDFSLERDGEALLALEAECMTDDGLVLTESRFVIVARKPG